MKVKNVSIKDIIFAEYNPRRLTDYQAKSLKDSLERFGFVDPVVINSHPERKNVLVGGHQRVRIWQSMGRKTVPGVYVSLDRDKERELNIRLNKNVGEWSWEDLANNFSQEELVEWGFTEEELLGGIEVKTEETEGNDEVPETAPAITKLGDFYELGGHRLLCGDSAQQSQVSRLFGGLKADLVITDPPYGIKYDDTARIAPDGHSRGKFGGIIGDEKVPDFEEVLSNFIKDGSCFYIFGGTDLLVKSIPEIKKWGHISTVIVWMKNNFAINMMDYKPQYEYVIYGWKEGIHKFYGPNNESNIIQEHWVGQEREHPTQKPVPLLDRFVRNSSKQNEIVLDLFGGSGTTIIASERALRKCFMVEIDPVYCDVIVKRYADFCQKNNRDWSVKRNGVDISKEFIYSGYSEESS